MNKNPQPTQADEYRELSSDLRTKLHVLAVIFTAWWAVNGAIIAFLLTLLTIERLSAMLLIVVALFGFVINFALNFHVRGITYIYHKQSKRLKKIQRKAKIYRPKAYRPYWRWLKPEILYSYIGISLIIIWFGIFTYALVSAFHCGLLTPLTLG